MIIKRGHSVGAWGKTCRFNFLLSVPNFHYNMPNLFLVSWHAFLCETVLIQCFFHFYFKGWVTAALQILLSEFSLCSFRPKSVWFILLMTITSGNSIAKNHKKVYELTRTLPDKLHFLLPVMWWLCYDVTTFTNMLILSNFSWGREQIINIRWRSRLLISQHKSLTVIHTNDSLSWLRYLEFGLRFSTARCVPLEALLDHLLLRTSSYEAL